MRSFVRGPAPTPASRQVETAQSNVRQVETARPRSSIPADDRLAGLAFSAPRRPAWPTESPTAQRIAAAAPPGPEPQESGRFDPSANVRMPNRTGLPDRLKANVEALSGLSMDDVRVHRNSPKPAQLQALAYAQGTEIHLGPGQERHLPHEAWHVVQQKQGRVRPTFQSRGYGINDDSGLEREADCIGRGAVGMQGGSRRPEAPLEASIPFLTSAPLQRQIAGLEPYADPDKVTESMIREFKADVANLNEESPFSEAILQNVEFVQRIQSDTVKEREIKEYISSKISSQSSIDPRYFGPRLQKLLNYLLDVFYKNTDLDKPETRDALSSGLQATSTAPTSNDVAMNEANAPADAKMDSAEQDARHSLDHHKVSEFVNLMLEKDAATRTERKYRIDGQRIFLSTNRGDTLYKLSGLKSNKIYTDPTYSQTTNYIDEEFGVFWDKAQDAGLNPAEIQNAYDIYLDNQTSSCTPAEKKGKTLQGDIWATGASPYTVMTRNLLREYQNAHYRETLQSEGDAISEQTDGSTISTRSTRNYEFEYLQRIWGLPFSMVRAFALTEATGGKRGSMLNEIGGLLDVQTATTGGIGAGTVYKTVFKHFQSSMEILNDEIDKEANPADGSKLDQFIERTKKHMERFKWTNGMLENEKKTAFADAKLYNTDPEATWSHVQNIINDMQDLFNTFMAYAPGQRRVSVPRDLKRAFASSIATEGPDLLKQIEVLGTIVGLSYKWEKRKILNSQLIDRQSDVSPYLKRLRRLNQVENMLNSLAKRSGLLTEVNRQSREKSSSKGMTKELRDLTTWKDEEKRREEERAKEAANKRKEESNLEQGSPPSKRVKYEGGESLSAHRDTAPTKEEEKK